MPFEKRIDRDFLQTFVNSKLPNKSLPLGKLIKRAGSIIGGTVSGAIAGVGTSINIPLLGGAILTGVAPIIAAVVLGLWVGFGIHHQLKDVEIVRVAPLSWTVEVLG